MNCEDFLNKLDSVLHAKSTHEMVEHCKTCPSCKRKLTVNELFDKGMEILKKIPSPPGLPEKITQNAVAQKLEVSRIFSLFKQLVRILAPTTPLRSTVFYGFAGILIFFMSKNILEEASRQKEMKISAKLETSNPTCRPRTANIRPPRWGKWAAGATMARSRRTRSTPGRRIGCVGVGQAPKCGVMCPTRRDYGGYTGGIDR